MYNYTDCYDVQNYVEYSYDIGPIPKLTEVIARFSTSIKNGPIFHTDANGLHFIDRKYEWSKSIPGNFYPMTYAAFMNDDLAKLTVISDRSHGVLSLNGEIEAMLHRNPANPEGIRLTDNTEVYPVHRILINEPSSSWKAIHKQTYLHNFPIQTFSAPAPSMNSWKSLYLTERQFLLRDLPASIHIQSFSTLDSIGLTVIFRLVHLFAPGEDAQLSVPVTIDFTSLFKDFNVREVVATSISGNKVLSPPVLQYIIKPSEIHTFIVSLAT